MLCGVVMDQRPLPLVRTGLILPSTKRHGVTVSKVHEVHASAGWPKQGLRVLAAMPSVGEIVSADC
jgi:hypothetical protein